MTMDEDRKVRKERLREWMKTTSRQLNLGDKDMHVTDIMAWWFINFGVRMNKPWVTREIYGGKNK